MKNRAWTNRDLAQQLYGDDHIYATAALAALRLLLLLFTDADSKKNAIESLLVHDCVASTCVHMCVRSCVRAFELVSYSSLFLVLVFEVVALGFLLLLFNILNWLHFSFIWWHALNAIRSICAQKPKTHNEKEREKKHIQMIQSGIVCSPSLRFVEFNARKKKFTVTVWMQR